MPLCVDEGIGVIPWSPLARGRLTRAWDETTNRQNTDEFGKTLYGKFEQADRAVAEAVTRVARSRGIPRAQVALSWVMGAPGVAAPIVGISKAEHLADAIAAADVSLTAEERAQLEAPYIPHQVAGFS